MIFLVLVFVRYDIEIISIKFVIFKKYKVFWYIFLIII